MSDLRQRLTDLIDLGEPFSADDLTDNGNNTPDANHSANAGNSSIGALFAAAHKAGLIEPHGVTRSKAPHRKGGMIRTWMPTPRATLWEAP